MRKVIPLQQEATRLCLEYLQLNADAAAVKALGEEKNEEYKQAAAAYTAGLSVY